MEEKYDFLINIPATKNTVTDEIMQEKMAVFNDLIITYFAACSFNKTYDEFCGISRYEDRIEALTPKKRAEFEACKKIIDDAQPIHRFPNQKKLLDFLAVTASRRALIRISAADFKNKNILYDVNWVNLFSNIFADPAKSNYNFDRTARNWEPLICTVVLLL
ncbi:MAG: hypothetical protein RR140_02625 [Clostridia bacterium]